MKGLVTAAGLVGGAVVGYFLAGAVAFAVLLAAPVDEDDERFLTAVVLLGALLMVIGGVTGWRLRQRRGNR